MKNSPTPAFVAVLVVLLVLAAGIAAGLRGQVATVNSIDPAKLYITESRANAFVIVDVYNRVQIGGWLKVIGPKVEGASAISVPAAEWFPPEKTRIESTHEPHVAKQDDGSWQITFTTEP